MSTQQAESAANPYAPPRAQVDDVATADGRAAHEPAGRARRLVAAILDLLIVFPPAFALGAFGAGLGVGAGFLRASESAATVTVYAFGAIYLCVIALVTYRLVKRNGQTIAKRWLGIKVVRLDGSPASVGRIFWLRNVVNAVPGMIPLLGLLYVLVDHLMIFGERRRCLHDVIADTRVVRA